MTNSFCVVYVTAPSQEAGEVISQSLLDEGLAACVNMVSGVSSRYLWQGKVETDSEVLLVVKTRLSHLGAIERVAKEGTGYDTPEVIALPIVGGSAAYLDWLGESC